MKCSLALLLIFTCYFTNAQQCNQHALMKQGTRLEYFISSPGMMRNKPIEMQVSLTVSRVVDSSGAFYSEIIKEGYNSEVEKDRYRRLVTLQCDGKNIKIPFDLYQPDTVFQSQIDGGKRSRGVFSANEPITDDFFSYIIPLTLEGITALPESDAKVIKQKSTMRPQAGGKNAMTYYWKMLSVKVAGKDKISTAAGTFDCFKVLAQCTVELGRDVPVTIVMYINNEVGLVRSRTQSEFPMAEIELVKAKK